MSLASHALFLFGACRDAGPAASTPPAETATAAPAAERAIVLVLDGTRYTETFGLEATAASDVPGRELFGEFTGPMLAKGALYTQASAPGITTTAPGHADLVTGRHTLFGLMPSPADPGWYRPEYPTLFEAIESARPDAETLLVANTMHVESLTHSAYVGARDELGATWLVTNTEEDDSDQTVIDAIRASLESATPPALIVANLHDIDREGHSTRDPNAYADGLTEVAAELAELWAWIESEESGLAGNTLLVVTADHGRHDWGEEADARGAELPWDYASHGDQCRGCRNIPLYLAGAGVRAGIELDAPATLPDVGATVAAALGVDLPYATGRVLGEAFESGLGPPREGVGWLAASDSDTTAVTVTAEWNEDPSRRADVWVGDTALGDGSFLVEDPAILATNGGYLACWRELADGSQAIDWPWTPQCRASVDGESATIEVHTDMVAGEWRPSLAGADGQVLAAWADNPTGLVEAAGFAEVRVVSWTRELDWQYALRGSHAAVFPGNPSLAVVGDAAFVAWAESDAGTGDDGQATTNPARYTRHIEVAEVGPDPRAEWLDLWRAYNQTCAEEAQCDDTTPTLDDEGQAWARMEFPALARGETGLDLAWVSWGDPGITVHVVHSDETYTSWTTPTRADDSGRVVPTAEPVWRQGVLYFARLNEAGTVDVCAWTARGAATCEDTGAAAISDLAADADGALALLYRAGAWAVESVNVTP